jgi:uncharacterized membrane protein YedE/YeeE
MDLHTGIVLAAGQGVNVDVNELVHVLIYAAVGVVIFTLAFVCMARAVPFSMRKEIEEDQNTALGVIVGSVIIGLSIVIASALHGGTTTVIQEGPAAGASAPAATPATPPESGGATAPAGDGAAGS